MDSHIAKRKGLGFSQNDTKVMDSQIKIMKGYGLSRNKKEKVLDSYRTKEVLCILT